MAVGAEERSRRDGVSQHGDDLVVAASFQDGFDQAADTIQRRDDGHLFGRQPSFDGARPAIPRRPIFRRRAVLPASMPFERPSACCTDIVKINQRVKMRVTRI